jgi:hypothetical protein
LYLLKYVSACLYLWESPDNGRDPR